MPKWLKSSHCKALRGGGHSSNRLLEPFSPCEEKIRHYERQRSNPKNDNGFPRRAAKLFAMTKKAAFTLAEVLITIAILGLVSTIVISNIIKVYENYQMTSRLKVATAIVVNAVRLAEAEQGVIQNWNVALSSEQVFNTYFKPYLSISKECGTGVTQENNNKCFYSSSGGWVDLGGVEKADCSRPACSKLFYKTVLKNGMSFGVNSSSGRYLIAVDINGKGGKSQVGKDIFFYTVVISPFTNMMYAQTPGFYEGFYNRYTRTTQGSSKEWIIENDCTKDTDAFKNGVMANNSSSGIQGGLCGKAILLNGWRVPEGYPY